MKSRSRSRWAPALTLALGLGLAGTAALADEPGKKIFDRYCGECHAAGVGHPGAQMLGWVRGEKMALLEQRTDLAPAYVALVVRHGLNEMPPFRPSEINDQDLALLASYLAHTKQP